MARASLFILAEASMKNPPVMYRWIFCRSYQQAAGKDDGQSMYDDSYTAAADCICMGRNSPKAEAARSYVLCLFGPGTAAFYSPVPLCEKPSTITLLHGGLEGGVILPKLCELMDILPDAYGESGKECGA